MNTIDELLAGFRADAPASRPDHAREVATRTLGKVPAPRATQVRLRWQAIGLALFALVLAGALVAFFVRSDKSREPADTPRVPWGMKATVTVTPDPGVSQVTADQTVSELIIRRAREVDVPGVSVRVAGRGQLELSVPSASARWQVETLLQHAEFWVLPGEVKPQTTTQFVEVALAAAESGTKPVGYIPVVTERGRTAFLSDALPPRLFKTRAQAERKLGGRRGLAVAIPAGHAFVLPDQTGQLTVALVAATPIVRRAGIREVVTADGRLTLRFTTPAMQALDSAGARRLSVIRMERDRLVVPLGQVYGVGTRQHGSDSVSVTPVNPSQLWTSMETAAGPIVPAQASLRTASAYGTVPPLRGEKIRYSPLLTRILKQRRQGWRLGTLEFLTATTTNDGRFEMWIDPAGKGTVVGLSPLSGLWFENRPACTTVLGPPPLSPCGGTGSELGTLYYGRAEKGVAAVDATLANGEVVHAPVLNGWYLIPAIEHGRFDYRTAPIDPGLDLVRVDGKDASGKVVGRLGKHGDAVRLP